MGVQDRDRGGVRVRPGEWPGCRAGRWGPAARPDLPPKCPRSDRVPEAVTNPNPRQPMQVTLHTPGSIYAPPPRPELAAARRGGRGGERVRVPDVPAVRQPRDRDGHSDGAGVAASSDWRPSTRRSSSASWPGRSRRSSRSRAGPGRRAGRVGGPAGLRRPDRLVGVRSPARPGASGRLGPRSPPDPPPVVLLSLPAFAMGMQNAAVASTTGLAVRTTHPGRPDDGLGHPPRGGPAVTGAARQGRPPRGGRCGVGRSSRS